MTKLILIGPLLDNDQTYEFDEKVIFVDGGINFKNNIKVKDFDSIGDQDSTTSSLNTVLDKNKDRSDLYHAFALAKLDDRPRELDLYGFIGGRLDHQLFNIGEAYQVLKQLEKIQRINFYLKEKKYLSVLQIGENKIFHEGQFSLSSIDECSIELTGNIKYTGTRNLIPLSSQGLSNISYGEFKITSDQPIIFFYIT